MEVLYVNANGDKYKIDVRVWHTINRPLQYEVSITKCLKGKRKFVKFIDDDSHAHRSLSMKDRRTDVMNQYLLEVPAEEINKALLSEWQSHSPELLK